MQIECKNCKKQFQIENKLENEIYRYRDSFSDHVIAIYQKKCPNCNNICYSHLDLDYYEPYAYVSEQQL